MHISNTTFVSFVRSYVIIITSDYVSSPRRTQHAIIRPAPRQRRNRLPVAEGKSFATARCGRCINQRHVLGNKIRRCQLTLGRHQESRGCSRSAAAAAAATASTGTRATSAKTPMLLRQWFLSGFLVTHRRPVDHRRSAPRMRPAGKRSAARSSP